MSVMSGWALFNYGLSGCLACEFVLEDILNAM